MRNRSQKHVTSQPLARASGASEHGHQRLYGGHFAERLKGLPGFSHGLHLPCPFAPAPLHQHLAQAGSANPKP